MLSIVLAAVLLCSVDIVNGGPMYFMDTGAYLVDADKLFHLRAPYAVRPVFYGLAIWPFHWGGFFFPVLLLQALIIAHLIYLTARVCGAGLSPAGLVGLVAALVIATPVSFHVSHLLPDIFVGALVLAGFLLGFCRDRLGRSEVVYLVLLATAAAAFHLSAIPVGLAIFGLVLLVRAVSRDRRVAPLLVLAPVLLGAGLCLAFSLVVFDRLALTPKGPPILLARILADGPGRDFLRATCPQSGFELCRYQDRLTPVEEDFLWRLLPSIPPADGYRIKAEAGAVIRGTVVMYPGRVIEHMLANAGRQLLTFGMETHVTDAQWLAFQREGSPLARSLAHSLQARDAFRGPVLGVVNAFQAGVALVGLLVSIMLAPIAVRAGLHRAAALTATVLTALLANAAVCGALSGVFARYQGRLIWLLPFAALASAMALLRRQHDPAERSRMPGRVATLRAG
jgi:hypothetical protein